MLTRELLRRLCRLTASRELESAPVEVLAELIDCANEALIEVWLRLPAEIRRLNPAVTLRAPTSVEVTPYNGSRFAGATLPNWIGCAIQMPGDNMANRLVSENALEREHVQDGTADGVATQALVWHDAIHIPETATILHDGVFLEVAGRQTALRPWPHTIPIWSQLDNTPGEPQWYGVRAGGFTDRHIADTIRKTPPLPSLIQPPPGWWLHLLPRPSTSAVLRFSLNVQGERITMDDYRNNSRLMLPDRFAPAVMRIGEEKVAATRLFVGDDALRRATEKQAEASRKDLRTILTSAVELSGTYGTPVGW